MGTPVWQMVTFFGSENWHTGSGKKVHEFHEYFVSFTLPFHFFHCVTQHCISIFQIFFWLINLKLLLFTCQFTTNSFYILVCLAFRNLKWNQTVKQWNWNEWDGYLYVSTALYFLHVSHKSYYLISTLFNHNPDLKALEVGPFLSLPPRPSPFLYFLPTGENFFSY